MNARRILTTFIDNISKYAAQNDFQIIKHSDNIIELRGVSSLFLYIKTRSEEPYTWGITKSRLDNFHMRNDLYAIILLAGSSEKGYFLTKSDIIYYVKEIWPLGKDGDYKVKPGKYLERNRILSSLEDFLELLTVLSKSE